MADLNGNNDSPFLAAHEGALSYRDQSIGEGTIARISITDSTGIYRSISQFGETLGSDTVDYFSFLSSGLESVTVRYSAETFGTYTNFLAVTPISGVSSVRGATITTWEGGVHATSNTTYREMMQGSANLILDEIKTNSSVSNADFSEAGLARDPEMAEVVWTLDGSPVFFEVVGMQFDGTFNGSAYSTVYLSDVDYTIEILPRDFSFLSDAQDSLYFEDVFGLSETHTGLQGIDTYQFDGSMAELGVSFAGDNQITVTHAALPTAPDTLIDVERIVATDGTIAFDIDGNAGEAYRLYEASFDRTPDAAGLGFWINHYDAGDVDLVQMAEYFMQSPEFTRLYGAADTLDDEAFLTVLYNNVLERDPDTLGFEFWRDQQDNGLSRAEMLQYFSESTENYANVIGQIDDGIYFI